MGKINNFKKRLNKGKFFILAISLLFAMESWAQNSSKTTVKVLENSSSKLRIQIKPGDYVAETVYRNKTSFVSAAVEGFGTSKVVGYPELPQYQTLINIPVCDDFSYKVTKVNEVTTPLHTSGYSLIPAQPSRSKSDKTPIVFVQNAKMYAQNRFWSPGDAKVEKLGVMRNTTIASLVMCPFSYNPVTGQMKKVTTMEIEITFKNPNIQATNELYSKYKDIYTGNIQSAILNGNISETKDAHVSGPLHYVIVSDIAFQSALQPFVTWKKKQGYIVTEAYTNNSAVGTTTTSIKAYLKGLYDNATTALPAPTYVLFVGDVAQIPTFTGTTGSHPTDLYYCTWTTGDNLPEAYYGRFSGTTAQHITNQVSKTVEYEKYLMTNPSFLNNMVAVAGVADGFDDLYGDGQLNYFVNNYLPNPPFTVYSYPSAVSSQSSASATIISKVNAGVSIADYSAHGSPSGWADPSFGVSDVATMTNNGKYPVMIGNCCQSNTFDDSSGDCFGEALLKAQNKGAVGYIGASNYSYWDEDYYFACGYKTVSVNAAYDATKLGSFDRLFHTHGEAYSAQYITTGQILNAGNLAVTQSGSSMALYYWEMYHLMGDPSLMPFLGVPTTFTPSYNSLIPLNSSTIAVTAVPPYAYVGITMGSTLLGATFADATGVANVPLSGVTTPGTADIVITAQNKVPHFGTITVQTPTGPYVSMITEAVVDATGNNNGVIDYNETAGFSVTLKNIGVAVANAVQTKLTTTSPYITMTDSLETYGAIAVDASVLKASAFAFHVSNTIPDATPVTFNLTITDNASHTWTSNITKTVNAPAFQIGEMTINDATGNNNGKLDAGETVQVTIAGTNSGHAAASAVVGTLSTTTSGITVTASPATIGAVATSGAANATFTLAVDASVPNPTTVALNYHLGDGVYYAEKLFAPSSGIVSEDYESGDFTHFAWTASGDAPWTIVNTGQYEGNYCSKSGAISDNQSSVMQLTMTAAANDSISFYRKVSSEPSYDSLSFIIDDVKMGTWSGELSWERIAYPVTAGSHTYKWIYRKDGSESDGSDCAWVDDIIFPPTPAPVAITNVNKEINSVFLFPNPTSDNLNITYRLSNNQSVTIQVFDYNGRLINTLIENEVQQQGTNSTSLNTSMLSSGLYFISIKTDKTVITQRFSVIK